ncbi:PspC domain-containing protein [Wenjunlia vitaminophila]|uniref:PspC domain-containing protein n=1 Tax=Wenjunlia vitaminophila TaxID=76728 RepID=UPI0003779780|nr:PspC domain-containing protein [Wenjunlia vitaminophila]
MSQDDTTGTGSAGAASEHSTPPEGGPGGQDEAPRRPGPLRRSRQHRVIGGVCGGLGRYFDVDPVLFRIVLGVLAVTGGLGLLVYGVVWLFSPEHGEEHNEGHRMLSGQVGGQGMAAVLTALSGCAVFLTTIGRDSEDPFPLLVTAAVLGGTYWSRRRRREVAQAMAADPGGAATVTDAPPAAGPPPAPGGPSWWRGGTEESGYLWGPDDGGTDTAGPASPPRPPREPRSPLPWLIGPVALVVGTVATSLSWSRPLGTALQIGLACALAVIGVGLVVSARYGRVRWGTMVLALVVGGLLVCASALPKSIGTEWHTQVWRPAGVAQLQPRYELGTGAATLDLTGVDPGGRTVRVDAEVSAGRLRVRVPDTVRVEVSTRTDVGVVRLPAGRGSHEDVDVVVNDRRNTVLVPTAPVGERKDGTLRLWLRIDVGYLEVIR